MKNLKTEKKKKWKFNKLYIHGVEGDIHSVENTKHCMDLLATWARMYIVKILTFQYNNIIPD